ncbi:MAG: MATE family efflux transporter [Defluviitaleaceae bacterium]|nr:MATE family efflux transporter [Defluviitaleaceae bacterium]MCL2836422.1 MATE family efflux transporter [Defluviitaleaceae bacterium]
MRKYDLTQGGIMRKLLLVAVPIMSTQLLQMSYNLTDMFWLGRLSSDAVAASGTAGMYLWLSMAFLLFGRMGSEIGVSQSMGKNDSAKAQKYAQNAICLAAVLGLGYGLLCIFGSDMLISFFGIREAHVARDAADYLSITGFGIPLAFVSYAITGTFNGSGNSRIPFLAHSVGFITNMALDPLFIFGLDMGVRGAAVATVIANIVCLSLMVLSLKKSKGRPFAEFRFFVKPCRDIMKQIFRWSFPISCESLLFTFLSMIITRIVFISPFGGADAQSVMRVGSQIESLSWLIGGGFGSAVTAFTGQNFGAGKWPRIHKGRQISVLVMSCWGVAVTLALYFFGRELTGIFLAEEHLRDMGATYLRILAFCQLPMCVEAVSAGILRGMGKTLPPSIISTGSNILRVPLAYALSLTALGLNGIWIGVTVGAVLRGAGMFVWCRIDAAKRPKNEASVNY